MKKILLLFLFFTYSLSGRTQSAGPIVDVNFSNAIGGSGGNQFKMGFDAGAYLKININDAIAIEPEMVYSRKGFKRNIARTNAGVTSDTNLSHTLSYIDFPFLVNITVAENGFIQIGPQIGYIINDKQKGSISLTQSGSPQVQNVDENGIYGFSTTEYSLFIGGGYRFNFNLVASLRFTYGITKLYDHGDPMHNISFGIVVGYSFGSSASGGGMIRKRI